MTTTTHDHNFAPLEKEQYDSLKAQGRSMYDDLRWNRGYNHNEAYMAARYSYGLKRVTS